LLRGRKWIEGACGCAQSVAVAQHAGSA
jgi:hypothetical protein